MSAAALDCGGVCCVHLYYRLTFDATGEQIVAFNLFESTRDHAGSGMLEVISQENTTNPNGRIFRIDGTNFFTSANNTLGSQNNASLTLGKGLGSVYLVGYIAGMYLFSSRLGKRAFRWSNPQENKRERSTMNLYGYLLKLKKSRNASFRDMAQSGSRMDPVNFDKQTYKKRKQRLR